MITVKLKEEEPKKEQPLYKRGDTFKYNNHVFILVSAFCDYVSLVDIKDGNRWQNATRVNNVCRITEEEFKKITNREKGEFIQCDFELIEK